MAHDPISPEDDDIHPIAKKFLWLADERVVQGFIWLPIVGLAVTYVTGYIFPFYPDKKASWEFDWLGSWGLIGFAAYTLVVLSAEPLFKLVARDEDYYGEGSDDE